MANEITGASLAPIYTRLNEIPRYHPMEVESFADWAVEAGDIITVSRDGEEYESPVHSTTMTWRGTPKVSINSTGNEKREPVAKVSKRKYHSGSGGYRTSQGFYNDIWSEDGHFHSVISQTASMIYSTVDEVYDGLHSEIVQTATEITSTVNSYYDGLTSTIKQTATEITSTVNSYYSGLTSTIQQTASSITSTVNSYYSGLTSTIKQTATEITSTVNSYYDGLTSTIRQTATEITSTVNSYYSGLTSTIQQTDSAIRLDVTNGTYTAEIVAGINESGSSVRLSADKVYIGNQTSTTVINGKLEASDITASLIQTKVSEITQLSVNGLLLNGNMVVNTNGAISIAASKLTLSNSAGSTTSTITPKNLLQEVQIAQSGTTYTLQYKKAFETTWTDAGTFSRAVTLSGVWRNGNLVVSSSPSGTSTPYDITLVTDGSKSGTTYTGTIKYYYGSDDESTYSTGKTFTVTGVRTTSHSAAADTLTFISAPDKLTDSGTTMYYYYNGTLTSAGTGFWYRRASYQQTQYMYT